MINFMNKKIKGKKCVIVSNYFQLISLLGGFVLFQWENVIKTASFNLKSKISTEFSIISPSVF